MSDWKQAVRFDEFEGLGADVALNFLQTQKPVRLALNQSGEATQLTPETEAAVNAVLKRLPSLETVVRETAFKHYGWIKKECRRIYGEQFVVPLASDAVDLQRLYQLQAIYFPEEPEEGRFGLSFFCEWEQEHGFGIQFRNWQIVEIGGDAEAFSFYD